MSFRTYERLPAREYAIRHARVHRELRNELSIPEPANDFTSDPSGSGRMLVLAFGLGALFWMILGWAVT